MLDITEYATMPISFASGSGRTRRGSSGIIATLFPKTQAAANALTTDPRFLQVLKAGVQNVQNVFPTTTTTITTTPRVGVGEDKDAGTALEKENDAGADSTSDSSSGGSSAGSALAAVVVVLVLMVALVGAGMWYHVHQRSDRPVDVEHEPQEVDEYVDLDTNGFTLKRRSDVPPTTGGARPAHAVQNSWGMHGHNF